MIDPSIFDELKARYREGFKTALWVLAGIAFYCFLVPTPEFEAKVGGEYTGEELINSLPEKYAYLTEVINEKKAYITEPVGFIIVTILMALISFLCVGFFDQICERLRKHDTPPPILPNKQELESALLKAGFAMWGVAVVSLSAIWHCLSPEYLLTHPSFWQAMLVGLPFWILVIELAVLISADYYLKDILEKREQAAKEVKSQEVTAHD